MTSVAALWLFATYGPEPMKWLAVCHVSEVVAVRGTTKVEGVAVIAVK